MQTPKFITIEGVEGVGKTTCKAYIQSFLETHQIDLVVTREPGGTPIAEVIRAVLLAQYEEEAMCSDTELLLMFASRAQHITTLIKPALAAGKWVLCDRFTDASYAYQGGGRQIPMERIGQLEEWVQGDLRPDVTFLLDAPLEIALKRAKSRSVPDRIESEKTEFFERVRETYLQRAKQYPQQYRIIDASLALHDVQAQLKEELESLIGEQ